MKIFKKVFALLVVVVVIFSNSVWTYAADTEECESRQVSLIEAENVAVSHIQGVMALDESSAWNNGVRIKVRKALFDLEGEIEAYYFGLVDKKGEAGGYVIVSADTSEIPILEYSQEGQSFIDISIEKTKKQVESEYKSNVKKGCSKVFYLGDMIYYIEHALESEEYVMCDATACNLSNRNKADKNELKGKIKKEKNSKYNDLWKEYGVLENESLSVLSYNSGSYITNPGKYESGYDDYKYYVVTNGNIYYYIMTDFSNDGVCAPTAATNLCRYWYVRDTTKYMNLLKDGSWSNVFWSFMSIWIQIQIMVHYEKKLLTLILCILMKSA